MTADGDPRSNMLHSMTLSGTGASYRPLSSSGPLQWRQRQRCLVQFILAATLVMLTSPTNAAAKADYEVHPGGVQLILPVEKRSGNVVSVSANERQQVKFKMEGASSSIGYSTKGRVSNRRIEATFGALGRIDVRLHLIRYPPGPPRKGRCRGRAPLYQEGSYHGTIEFSGQGDVPNASAKHGRVYFERRFRQVCKRQHPQPGPKNKLRRKVEVGFLKVSGNSEGHTVLLEALDFALRRNPARSGGSLAVEAYERHEGVRIATRTSASIDHGSFAMNGRGEIPETVEVELPEPFAGRALYARSPGSSPSWTGDLSVNLPGTGTIPLTGPGLSATLCRSSSIARLDDCASRS